MSSYLMIAIAITNLLAIAIVYQFIKKLETKEKIIIIAMSIAMMYVLISITYWISGLGVDKAIHEEAKDFIIYLFVPVNIILFVPYLAYQYVNVKAKHMKKNKFLKRVIIVAFLLVMVLVVEYFYFRNIQNHITIIGNTQETLTNEMSETEIEEYNQQIENEV